jgi:hypothetical protein
MTLVANIRFNSGSPFPATVKGGGLIAIQKPAGNIWTVSLNFLALAPGAAFVNDPANTFALVWNSVTNTASLVSLSGVAQSKVTKILNGAGGFTSPYAAQPNDEVLIVKQAAPGAFTITVDWSQRTKALRIVKLDNDANSVTLTPTVGQTQMGVVNFSYVIKAVGGSVTLTPLPDQSGAY